LITSHTDENRRITAQEGPTFAFAHEIELAISINPHHLRRKVTAPMSVAHADDAVNICLIYFHNITKQRLRDPQPIGVGAARLQLNSLSQEPQNIF
jgi:hypothetical protein